MQMLMIICPENRRGEVRNLIADHGEGAFSEIANVFGSGKTGKHLGSHTFPGQSVLIFVAIDDDKKAKLLAALKTFHDSLYSGEGLRVFALPVESIFEPAVLPRKIRRPHEPIIENHPRRSGRRGHWLCHLPLCRLQNRRLPPQLQPVDFHAGLGYCGGNHRVRALTPV